jgi:NitT/TauT family transport system substrate-binding protein
LTLAACGGDTGGDSGSASGSGSTESLNVQTYPGTVLSLPLYVAESEGFFEKHGLAVELVGIPAGPQATQALLSGGVDVMGNGVSNTLLAQREMKAGGNEDRILGILQGESGLHYSLMGQGDIDWPEQGDVEAILKALDGRTVGVTAVGADTQQVIQGLMRMHGLDPASVTFLAIGSGASAYSAFEAGHVDTIVGWAPTQTVLEDQGAKMLIDFRSEDAGPSFAPWTILTYQALESRIEQSPEAFTRFQDAMVEATEFTKDPENLDALVELFSASATDLTPEQVRDAISEYQPLFETTFDCKILDNELTFYTEHVGNLKPEDAVTCDEYMWEGAESYVKQ